MAIRVRRDVSTLQPWDDTLLWYARAIAEMQKRPIADPTSWRYQAAIHDYTRGNDPYADPGDVPPSLDEQRKFWRQCQHFSWFFLPWHRLYLHYFEEIVAAAIVKLGGPADWALPYWNYSGTQPDARKLPPAFIDPKLPDGSPNALHIPWPDRESGDDGQPVGGPEDVALDALDEPVFTATAVDPGFGGPKTGFNHDVGREVGSLETVPHGSMHVAVGGFMGAFDTAALDPIFWLHHCNIDRLWGAWRDSDPGHTDPADQDWLDNVSFDFHDAGGAAVTNTAAETVDTTKLGYIYDTSGEVPAPVAGPQAVQEKAMADQRIPEMVGASEAPTPLTTEPTTAHVAVSAPTGPALQSAAPGAPPQRVFVRIENVTGQGRPRRYSVYVNDVFAGIIPLFGVSEATRATETHGGGGLHYRLDVTKVVEQLKSQGNWDPETMRVTFVPDEERVAAQARVLGATAPGEPAPTFQVGRVSVFVA